MVYNETNKEGISSLRLSLYLFIFLFILISIGGVWAVGTYPNCSADSSIRACYHFNNDSVYENYTSNLGSNLIFDYSTYHNNNGTSINNITYNTTGGYLGDGAFEFDGVNDYINITSRLAISADLTYCFWIKLYSNKTQTIISKIRASTYENMIYFNNKYYLFSYFRNGTSGSSYAQTSNSFLYSNEWFFICTTRFNETGIQTNYVNSIVVSNGTGIVNQASSSNADFLLGLRGYYLDQYMNASIDEVIVWNRTLPQSEIMGIYYNYTNNIFNSLVLNLSYPISNSIINLSNKIYFFDGTVFRDNNTIFNITGNNVTLDCNGATLMENYSIVYNRGFGIFAYGNNISIKYCNFSNMFQAIYTKGNYTNISYNSFDRNGRSVVLSSSYNYVTQNNFSNGTNFPYGVEVDFDINGYNLITNNSFDFVGWNAIQLRGSYNNVTYNKIYKSYHDSVDFLSNGNGGFNLVEFNNVTLKMGDTTSSTSDCSYFFSSHDNIIRYNDYNVELIDIPRLDSCFTFSGNLTHKSYNNLIYNNNISNYLGYFVSGNYNDNNTFFNNNYSFGNYYIYTRNGFATNLTILDNYFPIKINNFTGTIFYNFTTKISIVNNTDIYNGSLSYLISNYIFNYNNVLFSNDISNQSIDFYPNIIYYVFNSTLFNTTKSWTNALFFYPNKSVNTNLRTITSNDGYFNVDTLIDSANNMSYALDNYILEETPKTNEPFQLIKTATSTLITYKIRSNLTNNVTVPINLSGISTCNGLTSLKITPKGGTELSYTDSASMTRICNELKSGTYNITLTQSNDSNTIILDYTLTPSGGGGGGSGVVIKDNCMMIYDFILKYYNSSSRKLEFTNNEFENLKLSTLLTTNELNNYLNYYPILCANYSTLPFIDYSPQNIPKELNNTSPNIEDVKALGEGVRSMWQFILDNIKSIGMFLLIVIIIIVIIENLSRKK